MTDSRRTAAEDFVRYAGEKVKAGFGEGGNRRIMTLPAKRLTLNISGEMFRQISWVAPFARQSEHAFAIEAIREKLERERADAPPVPAEWRRQRDEQD